MWIKYLLTQKLFLLPFRSTFLFDLQLALSILISNFNRFKTATTILAYKNSHRVKSGEYGVGLSILNSLTTEASCDGKKILLVEGRSSQSEFMMDQASNTEKNHQVERFWRRDAVFYRKQDNFDVLKLYFTLCSYLYSAQLSCILLARKIIYPNDSDSLFRVITEMYSL